MKKNTISSFRSLAAMSLLACSLAPCTALAADKTDADEWRFSGGLYAWGPSITTSLKSGPEATLDLEDILENLDSVFFGNLEAGYGKCFLATDVIYMKLSGSDAILAQPSLGDVALDGSMDIENTVNTTIAGYNLIDSNTGTLDAFIGARYLGLDVTTELQSVGPLGGRYKKVTASGDNTDGIIGVRGKLNLEGNWSLPYYVDYGTGDSDSTWQTFGGIDYQLDNTKLYFGYRYLEWDLGGAVDQLEVSGPMIGFNYSF